MNEMIFNNQEQTDNKFLTFTVGNDELGMPISLINTIYINQQSITEVPGLPSYLRGLINMRGSVVPVMDVRVRFGLSPKEFDDRTCIIVCEIAGTDIGLIVDAVRDVDDILPADISPPALSHSQSSRYINGIGKTAKGTRLLLDCDRLVSD